MCIPALLILILRLLPYSKCPSIIIYCHLVFKSTFIHELFLVLLYLQTTQGCTVATPIHVIIQFYTCKCNFNYDLLSETSSVLMITCIDNLMFCFMYM